MTFAILQNLLNFFVRHFSRIIAACTVQQVENLSVQSFQHFLVGIVLGTLCCALFQQGIQFVHILLQCLLVQGILVQALLNDFSLKLSLCVAVEVHAHVGRDVIIGP